MLLAENLASAFALTVVVAPTPPAFVVFTLAANVTPPLLVLLIVIPIEGDALPPNARIPPVPPTVCAPAPLNSRVTVYLAPVETPPIVPLLVKLPAACSV